MSRIAPASSAGGENLSDIGSLPSNVRTAFTSFCKNLAANFGSGYIHLLIYTVGSILCFILSTGPGENIQWVSEDKSLEEISSAAIVAVIAPWTANRVVDNCQQYYLILIGKDPSSFSKRHFLNDAESVLAITGLLLPPVLLFWIRVHPGHFSPLNNANILLNGRCVRDLLVTGTLLSSLSRSDGTSFPSFLVTIVSLLYTASNISVCYTSRLTSTGLTFTDSDFIATVRSGTLLTAVGIIYLMFASWIFRTFLALFIQKYSVNKGSGGNKPQNDHRTTSHRPGLSFHSHFGLTKVDSVVRRTNSRVAGKDIFVSRKFYERLYTAAVFVYFTILIAPYGQWGEAVNYDPVAAFTVDTAFIFLGLSLVLLKMRSTKAEIVMGSMALLEARKKYIRYMSHELRTPLNSAVLGLKLLLDELQAGSGPRDAEHFDTASDISKSVMAAVEILDSLLCFDKIENGMLMLHRQEVNLMEFLNECVTPFAPQARECGAALQLLCEPKKPEKDQKNRSGSGFNSRNISFNNILVSAELLLTVTNGTRQKDLQKLAKDIELSLTSDDVIVMDKFKMAQVMRNLISNALKFCPRESGEVEVRATFIPNQESEGEEGSRPPSVVQSVRSLMSNRRDSTGRVRGLPENLFTSKLLNRKASSKIESVGSRAPRRLNAIAPKDDDNLENGSVDSKNRGNLGKLRITITDNGAGISAENQKRLFTEIVQFNPELLQAGGGSGMGLLITKGIVDVHEGSIDVYSEGEGKGCKFTIEIPMRRKAKTNDALSSPEPVRASPRSNIVEESREPSAIYWDDFERSEKPDEDQVGEKVEKDVENKDYVNDGKDQSGEWQLQPLVVRDEHEQENGQFQEQMQVGVRFRREQTERDLDGVFSRVLPSSAISKCDVKRQVHAADEALVDEKDVSSCRVGSVVKSADAVESNSHIPPSSIAVHSASGSFGGGLSALIDDTVTDKSVYINSVVHALTSLELDDVIKQNLSGLLSSRSRAGVVAAVAATEALVALQSTTTSAYQLDRIHYMSAAVLRSRATAVASSRAKEFYEGPKYRVLIVDDSDLTRKMLRKTLQAVGHTCEEAEDGQIAVMSMKASLRLQNSSSNLQQKDSESGAEGNKNFPYDCILMDFVMPNMDGPSATSEIRAMGFTAPIFGVTGNTVDSDIEIFMKAGVNKVFRKPFRLDQFHESMHLLDHRLVISNGKNIAASFSSSRLSKRRSERNLIAAISQQEAANYK